MHLAIDAVGVKHSGGATVLLDLLDAALGDERVSQLTLFCSPRPARRFQLPRSDRLIASEQPFAERNRLYRLWWFERELARKVEQSGADVLLCMSWGGRAPRGVPQATFVQQSLLFSKDAYRTFGAVARASIDLIRFETRRACLASDAVFVQTPTMRRWVADGFGISEDRVHAFMPSSDAPPPGAEPSPALDAMRATPSGLRLLYVGNDMPYKNLERVARAMTRLRAEIPGATLFATVPDRHPLLAAGGVASCGYLDAGALGEAYRLADALVMPSLVETVGLPMMEAMSAGTPVLAADRPYAHDVCEDAAAYFDPSSEDGFVRSASALLTDAPRRATMRARGLEIADRRRRERPYARMVDALAGIVKAQT